MMGPARMIPPPAPMPRMADMTPDAGGDLGFWELVTDDAEGQGEDRPAGALDGPAGEHHGQGGGQCAREGCPADRLMSTTTSIFSLPTMSPTRPRMGVAMAALRR